MHVQSYPVYATRAHESIRLNNVKMSNLIFRLKSTCQCMCAHERQLLFATSFMRFSFELVEKFVFFYEKTGGLPSFMVHFLVLQTASRP